MDMTLYNRRLHSASGISKAGVVKVSLFLVWQTVKSPDHTTLPAMAFAAPGQGGTPDLSGLVQKVETAQLESRPLTQDEATSLDLAVENAADMSAKTDLTQLRSLAHRLWAALGHGPPGGDKLQDAKCRNLACSIFAASCKSGISPQDAVLMSAHWAFCGRAWMLADSSCLQSLPCFVEASKAWKIQPSEKLAEVAARAFLWAGEAHFQRASYSDAFSQLSQARDIICSYPQWQGMLRAKTGREQDCSWFV